jgi:hypothetical protein
MGRLIAVLALAGAAAFAAHPGSSARTRANAPAAPAAGASSSASDVAVTAAERDFARHQAEVALSGSAPLFGAEGLPKPLK